MSTRKPTLWFSLLGCKFLAAMRELCQVKSRSKLTALNIHRVLYRKAKDFVTTLVQKAKSLFYNTMITEVKSTKELYQITKIILDRTRCTQFPTIFPPSNLPNQFSEFFQNKISKIQSDVNSEPCASTSSL